MNLTFRNSALRKLAHDPKMAQRALGARCAQMLKHRPDDLLAATNLDAMRHLAGRCQELKGGRAGELAIDLEHPKRLVFKPADGDRGENGALDWTSVTSVEITEIVDYH